jgi:endonuclease/exonuclease/phosphatase family metal-dependent hydrolase
MESINKRGLRDVFVYSILFLFFFQLITDFIAGIYAFGLMGTEPPPEIAALVLLLSPFLLLFFKRGLPVKALIVLGELVLLCRGLEILMETRYQMLVAGIGTGLFLFLFPALLWKHGQIRDKGVGLIMAAGLALAVAMAIVLRSLGSTMDLSNVGWFRIGTWVLAMGAAILLLRVFQLDSPSADESDDGSRIAGLGKSIGLGFGVISVFVLLYFAFTSPAVIARWTGSNHILIVTIAALALVAFAWLLGAGKRLAGRVSPVAVLAATAGFALALTLTLAVNQAALPSDPAGYPFVDPGVSSLWIVVLLGLLILYPVLFLDFGLLVEETVLSRTTTRKLGFGFGLASLFLLLMTISNVFTSVWAYIDPVLETLFRNRFWQIYMLVGIVLTISMLVVSKAAIGSGAEVFDRRSRQLFAGIVTALCLTGIAATIIQAPDPAEIEIADGLTVAGYNLRQGYGLNGQRSHEEQCEVLKEIEADIIALSENDTARIAGGNFDIVRYLAECLDMYSYAGPKTGIGAFGYALLSKYPIENPETYHLFSGPGLPSSDNPEKMSGGDQAAVIKGQITGGGETYNVFVVHFDSSPPGEQPLGLTELTTGVDNVIAVGDYNCHPGSECFEIIAGNLTHCAQSTGNADEIAEHIDHVFVSPDLQCNGLRYIESNASDHPVVVADIE